MEIKAAKVKVREGRTFGIEIEGISPMATWELADELSDAGIYCTDEGYNHHTRSHWKIVPDESVHASYDGYDFELVSPPLEGSAGLAELERVCQVLADVGCTVNPSCGLHVHHDAGDFDLAAWKILVKSYLKYEDTIDELMDVNRRRDENWMCHSMRVYGESLPDMFRRVDRARDTYQIQSIWCSRFVKLNLEAYEVHGTVEFRQHGGSVDFTEIAAWIALTQGLVARAVSHKPVTLTAIDKPFESLMWTAHVSAWVKRYYLRRYALTA